MITRISLAEALAYAMDSARSQLDVAISKCLAEEMGAEEDQDALAMRREQLCVWRDERLGEMRQTFAATIARLVNRPEDRVH